MMMATRSAALFLLCLLVFCLPGGLGLSLHRDPRGQSGDGVFRVLEISSQPSGDGHVVVVRWEGPETPAVYFRGNYSSEFKAQNPSGHFVRFHTGSTEYLQESSLVLILRNEQHTLGFKPAQPRPTSVRLHDFTLTVEEGRDVTYTRGDPVDLHVSLTWEMNHKRAGLRYDIWAQSEAEDDTVVPWRRSGLEVVASTGSNGDGRLSQHVRVQPPDSGAVLDVSGFFHSLCRSDDSTCYLKYYDLRVNINLHPEDQAGPFLPGFVGFVARERDEVAVCNLGATYAQICPVYCQAMGNNPSAVDMQRVEADGSLSPVRHQSIASPDWQSLAVHTLDYDSLGESDVGVSHFQCTVRSRTREVTKQVFLVIRYEAAISQQRSSVTILSNGSVQVRCVAEGKPVPTVTFLSTNYQSSLDDVDPQLYDVTQNVLDDRTSEAVLTIFDNSTATSLGYVTCFAQSVGDREGQYSDVSRFDLTSTYNNPDDLPAHVRYYLENYVLET